MFGFVFLTVLVSFAANLVEACTQYGDMMLLTPTGASIATARPDSIQESGVAASNRLVEIDYARLQRFKDCFDRVGSRHGIYPALIGAIASRESRVGNALDSRGYGDNGNGYGIMQCDIRHSGLNCTAHAYNSCDHIEQLVRDRLIVDIQAMATRTQTSSWRAERRLQAGVAAYNFGVRNAQTWEELDVGTTHNDYSNDVIARAQHLVRHNGWTCPNDVINTRTYETCARFGNMMLLTPSGASVATARPDNIQEGGVAASNLLVEIDNERLHQYRECFSTVGSRHGIFPALIGAIASRESRVGNALDSRGYGDNGNGYGIMQCDIRHSGLNCTAHAYNSCDHIEQLVRDRLIVDIQAMATRTQTSSWRAERRLQAGVAAYNFGVRNAQTWEELDVGTTHNDYSNDVIARAQHLVRRYGWTCPTDCKALAEGGDCQFYRVCVQAKLSHTCNESTDYPMAYGFKYCNKFDEHYDEYTDQGKLWIDNVRPCLMNELLPHINTPGRKCATVTEIAFDSHVECYLNSGPGFCAIVMENMNALCNVYDAGDFFKSHWKLAWKQVFKTISKCWSSLDVIEAFGAATSCARQKLGSFALDLITDRKRRSVEGEEDAVNFAHAGNCKFWEALEEKFPCHGTFGWSVAYSSLLPICIKFQRLSGIGPSNDIASWMELTQQCLMSHALPLYRETSIDCLELDTTIISNTVTCMVQSGFCDLNRADEFFLDRGLNTRGFPYQHNNEYTTLPLSGRTRLVDDDYFYGLKWFRALMSEANVMCYQHNWRASPNIYEQMYSPIYNTYMNFRTEN